MSPSTAPCALQEGRGPIHAPHHAMDRAVPCCSHTDLEHAGSQHAGQQHGPDMKAAVLISPRAEGGFFPCPHPLFQEWL